MWNKLFRFIHRQMIHGYIYDSYQIHGFYFIPHISIRASSKYLPSLSSVQQIQISSDNQEDDGHHVVLWSPWCNCLCSLTPSRDIVHFFTMLRIQIEKFREIVHLVTIISDSQLHPSDQALYIFPLSLLCNKFRSHQITKRMMVIMWFSGLRGAIAYALSLHLGTLFIF